MATMKTLLERVQDLPIELVREIKDRLDPETQIDLLKHKSSVYVPVNKTVQREYVKMYLKEPSMRALLHGLKKETTSVTHKVRDSFGENKYQSYPIHCELPGNVVAKMYETNIYKPMMKVFEKLQTTAPVWVDLNGKMKSNIHPLVKSLETRFKTLVPPRKPTYTNDRIKSRYARILKEYHSSISYEIYKLLKDFDGCSSFIDDLDCEIKMSSLRFMKTLFILSKKYLPCEVDTLLSKRTLEDVKIDKNRKAYYAKNLETANIEREQQDMLRENEHMNDLMRQEEKIRQQRAKEQRQSTRVEAKAQKLREKEEKTRLKEERANKKMQQEQEKVLRAILREQTRVNKAAEKKRKDAEMAEKYAYKMIRTMFV